MKKEIKLLIKHHELLVETLIKSRNQLILCTLIDKSGQCKEMVEKIEEVLSRTDTSGDD